MGCFIDTVAFRLLRDTQFSAPIPSVSADVVVAGPSQPGDIPIGIHNYEVYPSLDGSMRFIGLTPGTVSREVSSANRFIRLNITPTVGIHAYWIWHEGPTTSGQFRFQGWVDHSGKTNICAIRPEWIDENGGGLENVATPVSSEVFPLVLPMNRIKVTGPADAPVISPPATIFFQSRLMGLDKQDLGDTSDREDVNMVTRQREVGVKRRVDFQTDVRFDSQEYIDLLTVYNAKLLAPDVRLQFTTSFDADNPIWWDAIIEGDMTRQPLGGVNQFITIQWLVVQADRPLTNIPHPIVADGRGVA